MIEEIDELLNHHTVLQIAANILNERGVPSGTGGPSTQKWSHACSELRSQATL